MAETARLTITLPPELATALEDAVARGDYGSTGEAVRDALRDWAMKRVDVEPDLETLRADIDKGLADIDAGRVRDFDLERIVERGKSLPPRRSPSA